MKPKFSERRIPWKARRGYPSRKVVSGASTRWQVENTAGWHPRRIAREQGDKLSIVKEKGREDESSTCETLANRVLSHLAGIFTPQARIHTRTSVLYTFFLARIQGISGSRVKNGATHLRSLSQISSLSWKALAARERSYCFPMYYDEWVRWAERYEFC